MSKHSSGKYAFGFCDRTGFRYPLADLVYEYKNGVRTGLRVGKDIADADHPQNFIGSVKTDDNQSLYDPRPDTGQDESRRLHGWNPVGNNAISIVSAVGAVTVTIS